jgi:hypothetical protein
MKIINEQDLKHHQTHFVNIMRKEIEKEEKEKKI